MFKKPGKKKAFQSSNGTPNTSFLGPGLKFPPQILKSHFEPKTAIIHPRETNKKKRTQNQSEIYSDSTCLVLVIGIYEGGGEEGRWQILGLPFIAILIEANRQNPELKLNQKNPLHNMVAAGAVGKL